LLRSLLVLASVLAPFAASSVLAQPSFHHFESGPVRPLAISADGTRLFACNTPDGHLEILDLTGDVPRVVQSVPVGLEPVAVAVESDSRVWVVNHLSDSVSIVDVASSPARVVRTLHVGDEPRDVVFAGPGRRRAFVTTAHRGQHAPHDRGDYATPGVGRADVWVFDADDLGAASGTPLSVLTLFGDDGKVDVTFRVISDTPRALAVSPDGSRVYAAVFFSGNRTTTVSEGVVCDGGALVGPCDVEGTRYPGGLPLPNDDRDGVLAPEVGLIVRQGLDGAWRDELGRDWSAGVRFELPDHDVFEIDANAETPTQVRTFDHVGTVLFGMAVSPLDGDVFVVGTEALNQVRFEGHGNYVRTIAGRPSDIPASLRGHLHEARVAILSRVDGSVITHHLNPHIDYAASTQAEDVRRRTLAQPVAVAMSGDGGRLYVAALGSSAIGVLDVAALRRGEVDTAVQRVLSLREPWAAGPVGLVVDEARQRLYVATLFDDAVVTVDLAGRSVASRVRLHSPEPASVVEGRPALYDAFATSSHGEASCGSCHVFGDLDALAWDLGDPDVSQLPNPNPAGPIGGGQPFSGLKGPMTTQSLRGLADHGPMHWRGDRTGGHRGADPLDEHAAFVAFDVAFDGLLGRDEGPIAEAEMDRFADFVLSMIYPPNPIARLDGTLREDEARGRAIYFERESVDGIATCNGCHTLDRSRGFFGGDGRTTFENEPQHFKIAHLRNAYTKVGMFGMPSIPFVVDEGTYGDTGEQVRGFGFLHDGSFDTLFHFFRATVFFLNDQERRDLEAFTMAFDTTLAPVVGQQVTLDAERDAASEALATLLFTRASTPFTWPGGARTTECALVVRGVVDDEPRTWVRRSDGRFDSDRASEAPTDAPALLAIADTTPLTVTCAPPGTGARALDRDEDGMRDADERDLGRDPADRPLVDVPNLGLTGPGPRPDGGMPELDGGVVDGGRPDAGRRDGGGGGEGDGGGCGCHTSAGATSGLVPAVVMLLGLRRRRRA
jgi:MYXO-CTERM domain-containing protein